LRVITILAGSEKIPHTIHKKALPSSGSPSLASLVHNRWSEAEDNVMTREHTDANTAQRFCTYLYLGDYNTSLPQLRSDLANDTPNQAMDFEDVLPREEETAVVDEDAVAQDTVVEETAVADEDAIVEDLAVEMAAPAEEDGIAQGMPVNVLAIAEEEHAIVDETEAGQEWPGIQQAISQSYGARPLTPLHKCAPLDSVVRKLHSPRGDIEASDYLYERYYYIDLLLAHARIYELARYHLCTSLQDSAQHRLVRLLKCVDCS
jgi:hypothetical protein